MAEKFHLFVSEHENHKPGYVYFHIGHLSYPLDNLSSIVYNELATKMKGNRFINLAGRELLILFERSNPDSDNRWSRYGSSPIIDPDEFINFFTSMHVLEFQVFASLAELAYQVQAMNQAGNSAKLAARSNLFSKLQAAGSRVSKNETITPLERVKATVEIYVSGLNMRKRFNGGLLYVPPISIITLTKNLQMCRRAATVESSWKHLSLDHLLRDIYTKAETHVLLIWHMEGPSFFPVSLYSARGKLYRFNPGEYEAQELKREYFYQFLTGGNRWNGQQGNGMVQ